MISGSYFAKNPFLMVISGSTLGMNVIVGKDVEFKWIELSSN